MDAGTTLCGGHIYHLCGRYGIIYTDFWKQDNLSDFYSTWCIASVTLFTPLQFFTHTKGITIYFFK